MKKAFVLGGTVPHKQLIKELKKIGYYVFLIDFTDNPPALSEADEHIKASTLDKEAVLQLAQEKNIDLIISTCIDQANSTCCYVAEKMNLPKPYSYATSLDVTKKGLMKTIFKNNGVPTSDFYILEKNQEKEIRLPFPFVIKPTDANSSKGVFKIENENEFYDKIDISLGISREGKAIVEGFVSGTEIQVDCIAINGKATVLMTRDKTTLEQSGKELQVSGFEIPGHVCSKYMNEIKEIAQKIVDAFSLTNTAFFYQAICNDNGVFVLEFAPRIAGGTTYDMVQIYSGFEYQKAAINSFLQNPIELSYEKTEYKYVSRFLYMKPGVFETIKSLDECLLNKEIDFYFPFVNSGKQITSSMNSGNRIGAIMVKDVAYEKAEERISKCMAKISILDKDGNDVSFWR